MARTLFDSVRGAVRRQMAPLIVFSFLANLLLLASSIYLLQVYDRVLSSGSLDTLLWLTVIVVLAIIVYGLLEQARRRLLSRIGAWIDTELSTPVIARSISRRLRGGSSTEGSLADVAELRGFFGGDGILAFLDAPWAPGFVAIIWLIHPWLGGVALAGAVLLFACALANDRLTRTPQQAATRGVRMALADAGQYVDSAETVAALGMTRPLLARWRTAHQAAHGDSIMVADTTAGLLNLSRGLRLVIQVVIIGAGAFLVLQGEITAGAMIAASIVLSRALSPVERSISAWRSYVASRAGVRNLKALFDELDAHPEAVALPRPEGRLSVESVSFVPPAGGSPILEKVSFHLEPGEACGIVGPSGAGKSTLCRLIVGVWDPTDGHVRLDGADVAGWDSDDRGRHVGYLPQQVELFSGTVAENIARMTRSPDHEIIAAAKLADVHEMILRLPDGYETDVGVHGRRLSGGQRQRIGLARALFGGPALIVLDEPNAGLDTDGDRALLETLVHLKSLGHTIVVVTHQPAMLRCIDKVLVLRNGQVEAFGARDEVLRTMPRTRLVVRQVPLDQSQMSEPQG
jgi:ATP-binding cassette, subfamily C, bacterial exporter for protease/lipase